MSLNFFFSNSFEVLSFCTYLNKFVSCCRYFGRKRLEQDEYWVRGSEHLVHPGYSYWTLGYVLTLDGAKKLLGNNFISYFCHITFNWNSILFL